MNSWCKISAPWRSVALDEIPLLEYTVLIEEAALLLNDEQAQLVGYFVLPQQEWTTLYCLIQQDATAEMWIASSRVKPQDFPLPSLSARQAAAHPFERELCERYAWRYTDHPWCKPLRYSFDRVDQNQTIRNYPFYSIRGEALHEVNVGPIHAGVIEPGCFRFICNGEQVIHLEIALGFQHRGVEQLLTATSHPLRQTLLCESIAGDSAVAHTTAYVRVCEALSDKPVEPHRAALDAERAVALELERIAVHIGDTGALCMDIGYQLGQVACEALRTITINTTQMWCGNRFGKSMIRFGGTHYPLSEELRMLIRQNMTEVGKRYMEIVTNLSGTSSVLARLEDCGVLLRAQAQRIGAVGVPARASGVVRDVRYSHPWGPFVESISHQPVVESDGDVYSRLKVRMREVQQSIDYVLQILDTLKLPVAYSAPDYTPRFRPDRLAFGMVEGWRGEVLHVGVTDHEGAFSVYKIYDPSVHNWMGLALAVRGAGISDFPICNKSFDLSYCGHDL